MDSHQQRTASPHNYQANTRWMRLANLTTSAIPPYSCVRAWPWKVDASGAVLWAVGDFGEHPQLPGTANVDGLAMQSLAFTDGAGIPPGSESQPSYGRCTFDDPAMARIIYPSEGEVEAGMWLPYYADFSGPLYNAGKRDGWIEDRAANPIRGFGRYPNTFFPSISSPKLRVIGYSNLRQVAALHKVTGSLANESLAFVTQSQLSVFGVSNRRFYGEIAPKQSAKLIGLQSDTGLWSGPFENAASGQEAIDDSSPTGFRLRIKRSGFYAMSLSATIGVADSVSEDASPNGTMLRIAFRFVDDSDPPNDPSGTYHVVGKTRFVFAHRQHWKLGASYSGDLFLSRENVACAATPYLQAGAMIDVINASNVAITASYGLLSLTMVGGA